MLKDVNGVWGGRQLPTEEKSKNSPSCMFGRFVPLNSLCFSGVLFCFCLKLRFLKDSLTGIYFMFICIRAPLTVCTTFNV